MFNETTQPAQYDSIKQVTWPHDAAFGRPVGIGPKGPEKSLRGLSKREYFAAQIYAGMQNVIQYSMEECDKTTDAIVDINRAAAEISVLRADLLIQALNA